MRGGRVLFSTRVAVGSKGRETPLGSFYVTARFVPDDALFGFLDDLAETIEQVAGTMLDHGDFVSRLPTSSDAKAAVQDQPVSFTVKYERLTH